MSTTGSFFIVKLNSINKIITDWAQGVGHKQCKCSQQTKVDQVDWQIDEVKKEKVSEP